jgi:hypothetical protein
LPNDILLKDSLPKDIISKDISSKDTLSKQEEELKTRAQLAAATRSMKTNLILGTMFVLVLSTLMLVPDFWRPYCYVVVFTIMRGTMPLLTAIANFGTVKFVAVQFLDYVCHILNFDFKKKNT